MDSTGQELLRGRVAEWFPLLPRPRPPCAALPRRIDEIGALARSASHGTNETRLSSAAEALNKAALVVSDCGLADLARQLCWRQFDIFHAATPLPAKAAKLALQPIVNLGRLATRGGDGARAYRIFQNAYDAVRDQSATEIDGREIDFRQFVNLTGERRQLRQFLWTILLADGTRALTRASRWGDAVRHLEQHKGIGKRMLDGRQVAILARCAAGDYHAAIDMLDHSSTPEFWEQAVAICLRTLCLRLGDQPADASAAAMVRAYLRLEATPEQLVFRTRLGLCVIDLAADAHQASTSQVIDRVIGEAVIAADGSSASDVLSHELCCMAKADEAALAAIVELSGFRRGTMPINLLEDLMTSVKTSEAQLAQVLARDTFRINSGGNGAGSGLLGGAGPTRAAGGPAG